MKAKHLCLLLLAFVAFTNVRGQNGDDLPIPMENDNQFPPEQQAALDDHDILEGSGNNAIQQSDTIDEPISTTTDSAGVAPIEDVLSTNNQLLDEQDTFDMQDKTNELTCPDRCLCNVEGDDFVTDCSGLELNDFPSTIDSKTTKLKLQNNKLTEIAKEISALTNLQFLNASNNMIKDLAVGSISTLSNLRILDLENNRMLEYPMDLKNSFDLTKLELLNLGGNDIREPLSSDTLGKFTSLEKIVVPSNAFNEQVEAGLCKTLVSSLKVICVETCEKEISCPDSLDNTEDDMLDAKIPATIFSEIDVESDSDPIINTPEINDTNNGNPISVDNETPLENKDKHENDDAVDDSNDDLKSSLVGKFSSRTSIVKEPEVPSPDITPESSPNDASKADGTAISRFNTLVEATNKDESANFDKVPADTKKEPAKTKDASTYEIGATTSDTKTGGVSKSIIGMIVAGMVVVVAVIIIKKNWTSIRRRFNSNSRTPDRPAGNANGTTAPEEVPLQDKSPV